MSGQLCIQQWVGDIVIDTKQPCDQHPESFTQDPVKPGFFTQDPDGRKTWIFTLKKLDLPTHHRIIHFITRPVVKDFPISSCLFIQCRCVSCSCVRGTCIVSHLY